MASYNPVIKNGASGAIFYVSLAPRTATGAWQSNPTLATGDVKVSIDGGALANLGTLPVVTPAASKLVKVTLSQSEVNGDNITVIFSDAAGAEWCDLTINLQTVSGNFDSLVTAVAGVQSDTDNIQTRIPAALVSGRMDSSVGAMATDVITNTALAASAVTEIQTGLATPTNITAGTITTVTNLTNAPTAGDFTATMKASITAAVPSAAVVADSVWDEATTGHTTSGTFGEQAKTDIDAILAGMATSAALATLQTDMTTSLTRMGTPSNLGGGATLSANLVDIENQTDDIGVAGAGLTALASAANLATLTGYVDTEVAAILAAVDTEVAAIKAKTDSLTFTTALRVDAQVFGMQAGTVTAAAVATDAIDADAIAANAVTEIQAGLATASELAAVKAKTDNLPTDPADASDIAAAFAALTTLVNDVPTAGENAIELLDGEDVETGLTVRGAIRIALAALAGKVSGAGTGTETFRNAAADSKDRMVSTVDVDGNRTAITLDAT